MGVVTDVRPVKGRTIFIPYTATDSQITSGQSMLSKQFQCNELGSGRCMHPAVAASASLAGPLEYSFWVNGNVFGIVYEIYTGTAPPSVMVDGIAYEVPIFPKSDPFGRNGTILKPRLSGAVLDDSLGDGPHYVEIMFPVSTTEARAWNIYGWLVDENAGYRQPTLGLTMGITAKTVGNAVYTNITNDTTSVAGTGAIGIRKVLVRNPTAGALTLTLSNSSTSAGDFLVVSIAAGDTYVFDPGGLLMLANSLYAKGSAAGLVAAVIEGW